ncbi:MAG: 4Fe-4S dicluster domain-containing protein [Coriobacteriales bacterium]|jgi:ferredoxin-like protein FixX|nr:4Fe-4S dicluster domain-containing protein [Coriobacteriales bacterium]
MSEDNANATANQQLTIEEKLAIDKFFVDEDNAHIEIDGTCPDALAKKRLVNACPAGLYKFTDDGETLEFDYAGCLECGTCRILGLGTVVRKWEYPQGSFGVEYRLG